MFCMKCGKEIPGNSKVCMYCGEKLKIESISSRQMNSEKKIKKRRRILLILLVVAVGTIMIGALGNLNDSKVLFGKLNAAFSVRLKRVFRST